METNTTQYEFAHGKKPRGNGLWAIRVTGTNGQGAYTEQTYLIHGKLNDAKRQACKRLKEDCAAVKYVIEADILS